MAFLEACETGEGELMEVEYRTCSRLGYISPWDGFWSHFGCDSDVYRNLEWLQIRLNDKNREFVLQTLREIHVPGTVSQDLVTIYGYKDDVDYIL